VFGGQVIGQALVAALRTVDGGRPVHSLHGYFIRPGDPKVPIIYEVDRYRDGASFTTRRVVAIQHGETILTMAASFHREEASFEHQIAMPEVPDPESLPGEKEVLAKFADRMPENMRRYFARERPIELRPTQPMHYLEPRQGLPPVQNIWIRATAELPDDPALHQCVLAYASDMTLLDTSLIPHGRNLFDSGLMMASLDHALWFHRPFRADEWLLYSPGFALDVGSQRPQPRHHLHPRRPAGGHRGPGRADPHPQAVKQLDRGGGFPGPGPLLDSARTRPYFGAGFAGGEWSLP
jgi:acyl-CoA thioesterase II